MNACPPVAELRKAGAVKRFPAARPCSDCCSQFGKGRGDGGTGWSRSWKTCFWARLKDGDHALKMFDEMLKPYQKQEVVDNDVAGGTCANLLFAHPPFQLDASMGGCAGVAEMLVQSHAGVIDVLPALPKRWSKGKLMDSKLEADIL